MFMFLSPIKSLLQIARRRRTSKIFTTNAFNIVKNLLTSALVIKSHDEAHSIASEDPNIHLAKGCVRARNKYIWSIPLIHPVQWRYQDWIKNNAYWPRCPGFIISWWSCYQYAFNLCQIISSYCMNVVWESKLVVSFDKSRRVALTLCLTSYISEQKNRSHGVSTTSSWEDSYVSGNSRPSNGKHAYGGTETKREEMWGVIIYKWKDPPVEECDG